MKGRSSCLFRDVSSAAPPSETGSLKLSLKALLCSQGSDVPWITIKPVPTTPPLQNTVSTADLFKKLNQCGQFRHLNYVFAG